ncbi:uncharacterized protein [Sagmatias obliquidens]|uniref:uncharacterized protein n=1 Tax=Sagmatias obliquidens TaxID=3371155 RepID=UPI000F440140|nr:uncharacterized protein LOC113631423 [Lagenorhynchus obliquidens]
MKVSAHEESPACMEVGTAELGGLDYRAPRTEKRCTLPGSWEAGWSSERLFSLFFMVPSRFRIQLEDLKVNDPPRSLMEVGGMPSPGSSLKESSVPNLIPQPISFQRDSGELSWLYGWTRTRMRFSKLQRAEGNEAINARGEAEKAAQPKKKPKVFPDPRQFLRIRNFKDE